MPRVPLEMTQSGAIASRAAAVGANAGRERSDRAGRRAAHTTLALRPDRADPLRSRHAPGGGGKCARREDAASLGAFPPVAPLGLRARGGRAPTPARRPTTSDRRGDTVVVLFGVDPAPANQSSGLDADVGFGRLATEEEADASAAERLKRLQTLVLRKRLYFEVLAAAETTERDPPERSKDLLSKLESPEELGELIDDYENRCDRIADIDAQVNRLRSLCVALIEENDEGLALAFEGSKVDDVVKSIGAKVDECVTDLSKHAAAILSSLPYKSLDDAKAAVGDAKARLDAALEEEGGNSALRPVVKTLDRAATKVKGARGLVKTGVSKLREKPLSAAASAADYTKGVWQRLNGKMDGSAQGVDPALAGLPECSSKADERSLAVLKLSLEVQDRDKQLADASKARDQVVKNSSRDALSRVRLARDIRESDDKVSDVRRIFAVRTLQVEMERILSQLEEEAADAPSLAFRADELELLVAEFGVMDGSLRKLVSAVDRGASELISDEDLTELATDIPDLKARLGIADDGLASMSLELMGERAKNTVDESWDKLIEGAEFMARGVKMLGGDVVSSGRFFGRAVMGSTLRPREVQTIRRTTLDIFTFVPFIIILIIPLTPVGHVLIFSFIQRYFPALFPSQFSSRRQELMKKYEELSLQLKQAEQNQELKQESEAITRAQAAVESLMMGGASEAELMAAMGGTGSRGGSFFGLKGLERMPDSKKEAAKAAAIKDVAVGDAEEDPAIRELREAATRAAESLESHDDDNDEKGGGLAH